MRYDSKEIDDTVKNYFNALKNCKPLTKKQEHDLLKRYKLNKDISARNELINSNLRYACKLAYSFINNGVSYSDLISEANNGLIESIERFDINKDVKLITYSKWWIMQKMQEAIDKQNKLPSFEIPEEKNIPDIDDNEMTNYEKIDFFNEDVFIVNNESDKQKEISDFINQIIDVLSDREMDMVNMYFGRCGYKENTLEEIGKKYKLTKERVRQIIETSFRKLRSKSMLIDANFSF